MGPGDRRGETADAVRSVKGRRRGKASAAGGRDELHGDADDLDAQLALDSGQVVASDGREQRITQLAGHVLHASFGMQDVNMAREIGIEPAGAASLVRRDSPEQSAASEGVERVVDGGETDLAAAPVDEGMEFLGGGVGIERGEGGVDEVALSRVAKAAFAEEFANRRGPVRSGDVGRAGLHGSIP